MNSWLAPEKIVGYCFVFLPGICYSLLPIASIFLDFHLEASSTSATKQFFKSIITAMIPVAFFNFFLHFTHHKKDECRFCSYAGKLAICPLHGDLVWSIGHTVKRKKLYLRSTSFYFGSALSLFLNGYIILETVSPSSIPLTSWVSIFFT